MQNPVFEVNRAEFRRMCRTLGLHEQEVLTTLIRRWCHEVQNQLVLETALRISIIKQEAHMPRRPSKPAPPTAPAAESAAAEMADPLAALPAADPLAAAADPLGAVSPAVNTSSGDTLDSLAQGVDQASIARALGAVAGTATAPGPDPVVAQALVDLKTLVSGFANRFDLLEAKIAGVESKLVDGQIGLGKTLKGLVEETKAGHTALLKAVESLEFEDSPGDHDAPAPVQQPGTVTKLADTKPAASNRHAEILAVMVPALQGRPNFNYKSNPAVPQALSAAAAQKGLTATGEEIISALASVGRVKDDGTIVNQ